MSGKSFTGASLLVLAAVVCPALSSAQTASTDDSVAVQETVVVTGSRGAPRTVYESLAPIDVISEQALELTASDEVLDSLA